MRVRVRLVLVDDQAGQDPAVGRAIVCAWYSLRIKAPGSTRLVSRKSRSPRSAPVRSGPIDLPLAEEFVADGAVLPEDGPAAIGVPLVPFGQDARGPRRSAGPSSRRVRAAGPCPRPSRASRSGRHPAPGRSGRPAPGFRSFAEMRPDSDRVQQRAGPRLPRTEQVEHPGADRRASLLSNGRSGTSESPSGRTSRPRSGRRGSGPGSLRGRSSPAGRRGRRRRRPGRDQLDQRQAIRPQRPFGSATRPTASR